MTDLILVDDGERLSLNGERHLEEEEDHVITRKVCRGGASCALAIWV